MYKPSPSHQRFLNIITEQNRKSLTLPEAKRPFNAAYGGRFNFQYGGPAYLASVFKEALESNNYDIEDIVKNARAKKAELYNQTKLSTYKLPISKENIERMFKKYLSYERSMSPEDYMSYIQERIKNPNIPHIEGWNQPLKGTPLEAKGIGATKNVIIPNLKKAEKMLSPQELKQWRAYTQKQQKKAKYQRTFQKSERFNPETGQFEYDPKIKQEALSKKYLRKNIRRSIKADAYKKLSESEKAKYLDFEKRLDTIGNIIKENPNYILEDTEVMNKLSTAVDPKTGEIYKKSPSFTDIKNRRIWEVEHIDPVVQGQTEGRGGFLRNLQVLPESIHKNFKNNAETFLNNHYGDKKYQSQVNNIIKKANELKVELRVKDVGKVGYKPTFTNFADKAEDIISTYVKNPKAREAYTNITGNILEDTEVVPGEKDFIKNISEKTNVPIKEVEKDLTNVQKVFRKMGNQLNSGMDPKLLIEYLGAEMKDIAAFGQKYGGSALGKIGKTVAGVDLPIFQVMFGSMYDIEQDSPLWLTIPAAFTDEVSNIFGLYEKSKGRFGLGKAKDFGKFLASSFVPRFLRSPIFKTASKVGKIGTIAAPLLEAGAEAYRFEKMKDARDEAIRQFKIPEEKGIKGFENYIRSTIPQDLAGQGFDELTVPDSPGLPKLLRDLKELGSFFNLSDDPYEIKKIRGDVTGTGLTSPMALQRLYDRQGLVEGGPTDKKRRMILKMLGLIPAGIAGLASLRFGPKKVKKVIDAIKTSEIPGKPEWFDSLVNKVIRLGEDVSKNFSTKERQVVHQLKIDDAEDVTVYRNLDDGEIRVSYDSPDNMGEQPVDLVFKPGSGQMDETTGKIADEFYAVEAEPRGIRMGPDDYDIEFDGENLVDDINDLTSDTSKLKQVATDKKLTLKEFVESKKKKDQTNALNKDQVEQAEYLENKYGPGDDLYYQDFSDYD